VRTAKSVTWGLALAGLCGWGSPSLAQQADSPLKGAMKTLGFATDVEPPADFVLRSRPKSEPDYIPVFQPPPEPARGALKEKELKALKGDLDSVQQRHDSIRQAFPPSAKAVAEEEAAARKKAKPQTPDSHF
jgi:hypothetical protein